MNLNVGRGVFLCLLLMSGTDEGRDLMPIDSFKCTLLSLG
jgi:hypothetical protein